MALQQLGPGGAEQEERSRQVCVEKVPEEAQQALIGPMEIVQEDDRRMAAGDASEEAGPCPVVLVLIGRARRQSEKRLHPVGDPVMIGVGRHCAVELGGRDVIVVGVRDAGMGAHHLGEGLEP